MRWQIRGAKLDFAQGPLLMGVLNVTPDSFYDGGIYKDLDTAMRQAERMISEGADIIDVGGESSRPGSRPVDAEEELKRVLPPIKQIQTAWPRLPLSIDTWKAKVASRSLDKGATIVNDISACRWDTDMANVLRGSDCGYVCMHALAKPDVMQDRPVYASLVEDIFRFLKERKAYLCSLGMEAERVVFDTGIGFGKTPQDNLKLLASQAWTELERPMLWGVSHKSFLSAILEVSPEERIGGTLAVLAWLLRNPSPQIWRVHDIAPAKQLIRMWQALSA